MATKKFKIGDLVRRINTSNGVVDGRKLKVGDIGKVTGFDGSLVTICVDGRKYEGNDPKNLELVNNNHTKFKIGDKVKVVAPAHGWKNVYCGHVFTIRDFNPNGVNCFNEPHYGVVEKCGYVWQESELQLVTDEKIGITHDGKTTTATLYREDGSKVTATSRCAPEDKFDFNVGAKLAMERLMEKVDKPTPVTVNGFKIGDRVNCKGVNGTIICFAKDGDIGVEFDDCEEFKSVFGWGHHCGGIMLSAGKEADRSHASTCRWRNADQITLGEVVKKREEKTPTKYYNGKVVCIERGYGLSIPLPDFTIGKVYEVVNGVITDDVGRKSSGDRTLENLCISMGWKFIPIVEDENKPLTTEEIKKLDGKKVWLQSLTKDKKPYPENMYGGWHTVNVRTGELIDSDNRHYSISANDTPYGFLAYRNEPTK